LLHPTGTVRVGEGTSFLGQLAAGWGEFRVRPWLWASVLHVSLLNLVVLAPFFVLGPLVARRSLGGAAGWATVATGYAVGAVAGGLVGLRWRPRRPLLAAMLVVFALAPVIAGLAIPAPLPALAVAALLGGLQASLSDVLWSTSLQQQVPADVLSRVSAFGWLGALVFAPLGYALAGPVANWIGVGTTLWVGAAWVVLSTGLVLMVPGIRMLRRTDEPEAGTLITGR
jgi:MFS family permease